MSQKISLTKSSLFSVVCSPSRMSLEHVNIEQTDHWWTSTSYPSHRWQNIHVLLSAINYQTAITNVTLPITPQKILFPSHSCKRSYPMPKNMARSKTMLLIKIYFCFMMNNQKTTSLLLNFKMTTYNNPMELLSSFCYRERGLKG